MLVRRETNDMPLAWLDHVNIRTAHLEDLTRFYIEVAFETSREEPI